jgi:hypothetical protein
MTDIGASWAFLEPNWARPYQNSKVVVPADSQLVNVIGDLGGLTPMSTAKPTVKIAAVS